MDPADLGTCAAALKQQGVWLAVPRPRHAAFAAGLRRLVARGLQVEWASRGMGLTGNGPHGDLHGREPAEHHVRGMDGDDRRPAALLLLYAQPGHLRHRRLSCIRVSNTLIEMPHRFKRTCHLFLKLARPAFP